MRILIISEYISPVQSVASIRWTKIGKYLSREGNDVSVLTNQKIFDSPLGPGQLARRDKTIEKDALYFTDYLEVQPGLPLKLLYSVWNRKKHRSEVRRQGRGEVVQPHASWKTSYLKSALIAKAALAQYGFLADSYDVVISTFDPLWPHMVARGLKERNRNLVWVADFRDPVFGPSRFEEDAARGWAAEVTQTADVVLYVGEDGNGSLDIPAECPVMQLSNGFDADDVPRGSNRNVDKFRITYTGTLYSEEKCVQNLISLFFLIQEMIDSCLLDASDVEFVYAGSTPSAFDAQIEAAGPLSFAHKNLGLIPRGDALKLQQSSALLSIATWNTSEQQGVATGKVWEYLMSGVPIVGTCTGEVPNSRMKEILEDSHGGVMLEECEVERDTPSVVEFIRQKYAEWKRTGTTTVPTSWCYLSSYTHEALASKVYAATAVNARGIFRLVWDGDKAEIEGLSTVFDLLGEMVASDEIDGSKVELCCLGEGTTEGLRLVPRTAPFSVISLPALTFSDKESLKGASFDLTRGGVLSENSGQLRADILSAYRAYVSDGGHLVGQKGVPPKA